MTTERLEELGEIEYMGHPFGSGRVTPYWEHLEYDSTSCMRGHLCPGYDPKHGTTTNIGGYLGVDSEGIYPRAEWNAPWYFPSAPGLVMCEDCASIVEPVDPADEPADTIFDGIIADANWFIDRDLDGGGFFAWVGYFAPDGGLDHEIELGAFDTVGAARTAVSVWGAERNRELDRIEAEIDLVLS